MTILHAGCEELQVKAFRQREEFVSDGRLAQVHAARRFDYQEKRLRRSTATIKLTGKPDRSPRLANVGPNKLRRTTRVVKPAR